MINKFLKIAIPAGKTIEDEMNYRNWTQVETANRLGISQKHLIDILSGKNSITQDMALKLETVFGPSAEFWLNIDSQYQLSKSRKIQSQQLESEAENVRKFKPCFDIFQKLGIFPSWSKDMIENLKNIKLFFNDSKNLDQIFETQVNFLFRKSPNINIESETLAIFSKGAEILANQQEVKNFDHKNIKKLILDLKPLLSQLDIDHERIKQIFNQYGIYYVFTPMVKSFGTKAYVRFYNDNPLIHITDRGNRFDIFWFTIFHELGHLNYKHIGKTQAFIESDEIIGECEKQADDFAKENILSTKIFDQLKININLETINKVAYENKIHNSFIFGRLCNEKILDNKQCYQYFKKIRQGKDI